MNTLPSDKILELPCQCNALPTTIRRYLTDVLQAIWREKADFDGKRPFGYRSWPYELYEALIRAEVVAGKLDRDGMVEDVNKPEADKLIRDAIAYLCSDDR